MEVETESINGSVANLKQKPPHKGRKKKSAVAKLAEKRRLNSDGGSEYGSAVSLQTAEKSTEEVKSVEPPDKDNKNNAPDKDITVDGSQGKLITDANVIENKTEAVNDDQSLKKDTETKSHPPKPVPRRLNQKKVNEKKLILDELDGGTVVSIYDKVEKTPTKSEKRDQSSSSAKNDISNKKSVKKELFPGGSSSDINSFSSLLGPSKPRGGLSPLGDLPPLDGGLTKKPQDIELSPPIPMDIDSGDEIPKDDTVLSKDAPSDATVHRFRAMRMTPDRSRSEESIKNAQFMPKPPTTPRSARRNSAKGEKRNRDANSSGEEADVEIKKQNSDGSKISDNILNTSLSNLQPSSEVKMEVEVEMHATPETKPKPQARKGLSVHPCIAEVKDPTEIDTNQNMNIDIHETVKHSSVENVNKTVTASGSATEISPEISPDKNYNISPDKYAFESASEKGSPPKNEVPPESDNKKHTSKKTEKKKKKTKVKSELKELPSLDGLDVDSPGKNSIETIGSASDLKAIAENYKDALQDTSKLSPIKTSPVTKPAESKKDTVSAVLPDMKASSSKLSPIQPRNLPPPLPHDMKSTSLRTMYKTDPSYTMNKFFGRSMSGITEREKLISDTMSNRSFSASTTIHALSTREARDRIKQGTMGSGLLSSSELDKYFPNRKVGVWIGSWNMAEIKDCRDPLDDFLLPEISEYVQDIYAIGTQENAMSKKEWEILLQETIGPSHVLFHSASHGALHLSVFVKRDLIWFCTVPEDDIVQTRAVTMVRTKGALAVCFQFFGTTFLFINSHFAPGDERKKERMEDYQKIIKHLNLPKQANTGSPNGSAQDVTTRFDAVFWMGDLNFRIEVYKGKQAVEDIVRNIQEQEHPNFEDLVTGDQLTKLIVEGNIFQGFQEGRINFRPTYKFDIGNDTYDTSAKNRIPSYTDRVLFRAKKKNSIVCTHYDSPRNIKLSDHRPVFALFEVAIKPAQSCIQPLAAGQFDRSVYTEANKRRAMKVDVIQTLQKEKSSKVCVIQ